MGERRVTVIIPAHNEESTLPGALQSLILQTRPPDHIVVISDNSTDGTVGVARSWGKRVQVVETSGNRHKKAGALNWWLETHLDDQADEDLLMVMDADSILNPDFLQHALRYVEKGYHAVGGVFLGQEGGGFVGMLQRNEYARYARDIQRRNGHTLVLTGTATVFTARCLKDVVLGRERGVIPNSTEGGRAQVYDTKALTEDNELTFAILHLGYAIIAPEACGLTTEVMETWRDLAKQRERWKRGAIENNRHYGLTQYTREYWRLQIWGQIGIIATVIYLSTLVWAVGTNNIKMHWVWAVVTLVYAVERCVTVVRRRGVLQGLVGAAILIEMPYDIFLQAVQIKAILAATFRTSARW